jgi:hypothetical protein
MQDRVGADGNVRILAHSFDGSLQGGEGAWNAAVSVVGGRVGSIQGNVEALQILQPLQVLVRPIHDGTRFPRHFHLGEQAHGVEDEIGRLGMR